MKTTIDHSTEKQFASDSGHWYKRDGTPCYELTGANGKIRPTTLRDAKKLNLVPSVTSIMQMYPKPGLNLWKERQAVLAALTLPRNDGESDKSYVFRVMMDAQEQAKKAAEKGTAIHGAIEKSLKGGIIDIDYLVYVTASISELMNHLECDFVERVEPEKSFAHPLGFGGKVDLYSRELNFICDFKTKNFDDPDKVEAYDENKIQLAAYRIGLDMPEGTRLINAFISTSTPGLAKIIEHNLDKHKKYDSQEEKHYWGIFRSLLNTWKLVKKYSC